MLPEMAQTMRRMEKVTGRSDNMIIMRGGASHVFWLRGFHAFALRLDSVFRGLQLLPDQES